MEDTVGNLRRVLTDIADAAREVNRDPHEVRLVAVTKTQGVDRIQPVLEAGHRLFGENRVQEAEHKWPELREAFPKARLHLIGPLQTNKVRQALSLFDVFETVDRPKLAREIAKQSDKAGCMPECFVQVNTGAEQQKAGVPPEAADAFIDSCRKEYGLPVGGLMCIPPIDDEPSLHFALLRKIAERNGLSELSMGMSGDYRIAIAFGATLVRIGTAIFGERESPPRP